MPVRGQIPDEGTDPAGPVITSLGPSGSRGPVFHVTCICHMGGSEVGLEGTWSAPGTDHLNNIVRDRHRADGIVRSGGRLEDGTDQIKCLSLTGRTIPQ